MMSNKVFRSMEDVAVYSALNKHKGKSKYFKVGVEMATRASYRAWKKQNNKSCHPNYLINDKE